MKFTIYVFTIFILIFAVTLELKSQSVISALSQDDYCKEAVDKAKERISNSDIGKEAEIWINSLNENNIKLKLILDEEGFLLLVSSLKLKKKLITDGEALTYGDSEILINLINTAERLGAPPSAYLKQKLLRRINNSVNKKWEGIINTLCGLTN